MHTADSDSMFALLRTLISQVFIVILIGCVVSVSAHHFVAWIKTFELLKTKESSLDIDFSLNVDFFAAGLLIIAFLIVQLIRKLMKINKWETPAEIIFCSQNRQHNISSKNSFWTVVASFVSLSGGVPLGQYGPLVHLGGVLGIAANKFYKSVWLSRDVMIGCGVAAAISAGFHAPIAGIIFAHEAVLRHFSGRALALISVASIAAHSLNSIFFENTVLFKITNAPPFDGIIVGIILIAGCAFGTSAIVIIKSLFFVNKFVGRSRSVYRLVAFFGLIYLVFLSQTFPAALGLGVGVINDLLTGSDSLGVLAVLFAAKFIAVILAANIGFSGGFVGPALFLGAVLGALSAKVAGVLGFSYLTVILIISGASAVAATVFGSPLAMIILVFELTYSYELTLLVMISIVVSSLVFHLFYGHSLFDLQLLQRGIDLTRGKIFLELENKKIEDLSNNNYLVFLPETSAKTIASEMLKNETTEAYCVAKNGCFIGKISISAALYKGEKTALQIAEKDCVKFYEGQSVNDAMLIAEDFIGEAIPVIERHKKCIIGVVSESELFKAYSNISKDVRSIETS